MGKGFLILTRVGLSFEFEVLQEQFLPVFWGFSDKKNANTLVIYHNVSAEHFECCI